jgi:hypothetical protein
MSTLNFQTLLDDYKNTFKRRLPLNALLMCPSFSRVDPDAVEAAHVEEYGRSAVEALIVSDDTCSWLITRRSSLLS